MSDEMKETRLLRFRPRAADDLREAEARQGSDAEEAAGLAREEDPELAVLLAEWGAPAEPGGSAARLLAAYREATARPTLRQRILASRVGVPFPVAACFALAFAASLLAHAMSLSAARQPPDAPAASAASAASAAGQTIPEVRYVEVPMPGEARVVYVEKRQTAARARRAKDGRGSPGRGPAAGDAASYFTPVDMAEFKPADEVKIRVVRKGER